jgi:hypothetical protein
MGFRELLDRVVSRQAEGTVAVPVATVDAPVGEVTAFVPNEVYLEVRISQMWLTRERELWREYQPFGTVVTEFINDGKRIAIPAVLGSAELSRRLQVTGADDAIEFANIRVAGPVPYEGDDVSLLLTLFRMKTTDWLARTFGLIEEIASTIGFSGLAAATPLATTLIRGVDAFLDADEVELRVGSYTSWSTPTGPDGSPASPTELAPTHYAILRRSRVAADAAELASLRVSGGKLHQLRDGELVPYREHDFILVSIEAHRTRHDIKQLEFWRLWVQTVERLKDDDETGARRLFKRACAAVFSNELTVTQQELMLQKLENDFLRNLDRFAGFGESDLRSSTPQRVEDTEDEDPEEYLRRMLG